MQKGRIKTLLIEDSAFMRKLISDILIRDAEIDLLGTASDGKEGSEMVVELKPDVVVTDMVMPDYDGMYVVNSIMNSRPIPIILLSSLDKTNSKIFDALQNGAFEFIDKPTQLDEASIRNYPLLELIKTASRTDISLLKAREIAKKNSNAHTFTSELNYEIVAIGASTGGPSAIETIVMNLPQNLQVPVIIAQHMPPRFLETFSNRLNERSPIPVKLARKGEEIRVGSIYIASGDANLKVAQDDKTGRRYFEFTRKSFQEFNNPSIDCLFDSIAKVYGEKAIGVILTGMGKDGATGLLNIRKAGGYTLSQDESSSVVFGMPKAAKDIGAINRIVNLKEIAGFIVSCL